MAIFRYAEAPADPRWRISPVAWDGTQVVADVSAAATGSTCASWYRAAAAGTPLA